MQLYLPAIVSLLKIRRIVGIAHVEDLESIKDTDVRSSCEKVSLLFARRLVVGMRKYAHSR